MKSELTGDKVESAEVSYALMEAHRNTAVDSYFYARPHLDTIDNRRVYESAHRRGWQDREDTTSPHSDAGALKTAGFVLGEEAG